MRYVSRDKSEYIDYVARIFVLAISEQVHPNVITDVLMNSPLIHSIEANDYGFINDKPVEDAFAEIFKIIPKLKNSSAIYNDAYWSGYIYMNLFYEFRKPFAYIFLTMPLDLLLELYPVYHEMDISQIFERFEIEASKTSILSKALKNKKMSAPTLARLTNISLNSINYYKKSDKNLYAAGFQAVYKISKALNLPGETFLDFPPFMGLGET